MNAVSTLALLSVLGSASSMLAQSIALDTFGPNNSYNTLLSLSVRGPNSPSGPPVATAHMFEAQATGGVTQIVTALRHGSGDNNYTFQIRTGNPNIVGPAIGSWANLQGGPTQDPIITIPADGMTMLTQGQTYFLVVIAHGSATGHWHRNNQGISNYWATSSNGGGTFFFVNGSELPAIRITLDGPPPCYPDCDTQTGPGVLDIFDFLCFGNRFSANDPYACDCDTSTGQGVCDIFDFLCFGNEFNAGCP